MDIGKRASEAMMLCPTHNTGFWKDTSDGQEVPRVQQETAGQTLK